jgi:hypothetical protein
VNQRVVLNSAFLSNFKDSLVRKGDERMTLTSSDIIGIIQTIVIGIGLIAIIIEYRTEKRNRGYGTYVQTALAHIELLKWAVANPEAFHVFSYEPEYKDRTEMISDEFCTMLLMNFEIIHEAWNKKWMKPEEWQGWKDLIKELVQKSPDFLKNWENEEYLYSKSFQDFINGLKPNKK